MFLQISTLGPVGYLRAPGTMATLATIPLVFILRMTLAWHCYLSIVFVSTITAFYCIKKALSHCKGKDPSEIVIDEYVGCLVTFVAVPVHLYSFILGFVLFRFFDIVKCFGIKSCEQLDGAWGVLVDDIVAGLFANMCLQILFLFSVWYGLA